MADPLDWRCACGQVRLEIAPGVGARVVCYCKHCRAFARHLDDMETLDAGGGSDILQVSPEHVRIKAGAEHLAALRLTSRGPLRWYATCCSSRVANTGPRRSLPLVSVMTPRLTDPEAAGPVTARVFTESATGPVSGPTGSTLRLGMGFVTRALASWLSGGTRRHPFFDAKGAPLAAPERPEGAARAAAYDERIQRPGAPA